MNEIILNVDNNFLTELFLGNFINNIDLYKILLKKTKTISIPYLLKVISNLHKLAHTIKDFKEETLLEIDLAFNQFQSVYNNASNGKSILCSHEHLFQNRTYFPSQHILSLTGKPKKSKK